MERLTIRKTDIVLFQKDGQYTPPISMNGEQVRKALERLAELEDEREHCMKMLNSYNAILSHCRGCDEFKHVIEAIRQKTGYGEPKICLTEDCPYQHGNPCEAAEGCGGYEGAEDSFLMQRFMRVE